MSTNTIITVFVTILTVMTVIALDCKITPVDEGDPITIQQAQLDLIRCQSELAKQQHSELIGLISQQQQLAKQQLSDILSTLKSVAEKVPQRTNGYDALIYISSSFLGFFIMKQILSVVWYFTLMKSDTLASLVIATRQLASTIGMVPPPPSRVDEYRGLIQKPLVLRCAVCCRKEVPDNTSYELA